jgi:hypothetical protein
MAALPPVLSETFLSSLRSHASLPRQSWYFIAAVTLSILNRPDEIAKVYQHALDCGALEKDSLLLNDVRMAVTRRIREALIKASTIGGVPKVSR